MAEELLPQITLTASGADLDPAEVLAHALRQYQAGVRAEAEKRVLAGPLDLGADVLSGILMEVASGHLNLFRITAGVALRVRIKQAARRHQLALTEMEAAQRADDAAMNLGAYLAATSSNAVMDGYHLNLNLKVPAKEAARRSVRAFGLTVPQMRTVFRLKDEAVNSSEPGAWRSKIDAFIDRAFGIRLRTLVENTLRQADADTVQHGWEVGLATGDIPATATKVWFTALDERTCPTCAPMDHVGVPVTDTFKLPNGNRVKAPPVHVNCRCAVELVYPQEVEEVAKAREWDPRLHPRHRDGEFASKPRPYKEPDAEARAVVNRILAGPRVGEERAQAERVRVAPVAGQRIEAADRVQATRVQANRLQAGQRIGATRPAAERVRTHAILGGQSINLTRLNMAHQLQVAATVAGNAEHEEVELPPLHQLEPMPLHMIAFATYGDLDIDDPHYETGKAMVVQPLHFVDRHDATEVREALNEAMMGLDNWLRDHTVEVTMAEMGQARDPGIQDAVVSLRHQILSAPRRPKGAITVSITPEAAAEAWRAVLAPPGHRYRQEGYLVEAFDETGLTVAATEVSAATAAALTNVDVGHPDLPRVVVAPYGGWKTESGHGATGAPYADTGLLVTGAFRWRRRNRVVTLIPDADAYTRAHPEHKPGT